MHTSRRRNPHELLILDQEDTLTDRHAQLFPGVSEFLDRQSRVRDCVVAARAGFLAKQQLKKVASFLRGCFGQEHLNASKPFYLKEDGTFGEIAVDFEQTPESKQAQQDITRRIRQLKKHFAQNEQEIEDLWAAHDRAYRDWHKTTHRTREEMEAYRNPNLLPGIHSGKDLHLLKRRWAPEAHDQLKAVMIGNESDGFAAASDPETPLIVVHHGEWALRKNTRLLLDQLFDPKSSPDKVFDVYFGAGTPVTSRADDEKAVEAFMGDRAFRLRKKQFEGARFPARLINEQ